MRFGFLAIAALATAVTLPAQASDPLPWGQSSDMLAWQVLTQVVAPAGTPGVKAVEFETWAADSDVYTANPHWPAPGAMKRLQPSLLGLAAAAPAKPVGNKRLLAVISPTQCVPPQSNPPPQPKALPGNFPLAPACIGEEVRRNWATFQYIVANHLYTTADLVKAYVNGRPVDLPNDALEVKADWAPVSVVMAWQPKYKTVKDVEAAFYTNSATLNGQTTEYALLGLAMSSKAIRQWVWMTFEHRSSPGRCDTIGCHDDYGATVANVAPAATPNTDYGPCAKTPAVQALLKSGGADPIWNNYCLKGTQINYLTKAGTPTLLGNSVIERINAGVPIAQSSCLSCHTYASLNNAGAPNFAALDNQIGGIKPSLLHGYKQNDFLWGLLLAK
ncbi:MAG TPA: hypothetical protein VNU97_19850 [Rhizomicrobium sp.]|jgi:hypothetical protein|nr:hypothetical protein [Rhizomicrobium sp.]